jgi:hypothetical protein
MFFEIAYKIVNIRILYQIAIYIGIFIAYVALETSLGFDDISPRGKQWLTPLAMTGWLFSIYEGFFSTDAKVLSYSREYDKNCNGSF